MAMGEGSAMVFISFVFILFFCCKLMCGSLICVKTTFGV
jgi:hypothetical protein